MRQVCDLKIINLEQGFFFFFFELFSGGEWSHFK